MSMVWWFAKRAYQNSQNNGRWKQHSSTAQHNTQHQWAFVLLSSLIRNASSFLFCNQIPYHRLLYARSLRACVCVHFCNVYLYIIFYITFFVQPKHCFHFLCFMMFSVRFRLGGFVFTLKKQPLVDSFPFLAHSLFSIFPVETKKANIFSKKQNLIFMYTTETKTLFLYMCGTKKHMMINFTLKFIAVQWSKIINIENKATKCSLVRLLHSSSSHFFSIIDFIRKIVYIPKMN